MARYFVQAQRRSPSSPMSSVSYYCVNERGTDEQGRPFVAGVERFSVRMLGAAEALHRANELRDRLNGPGPQITDAQVRAYIAQIAAADSAAGIQ